MAQKIVILFIFIQTFTIWASTSSSKKFLLIKNNKQLTPILKAKGQDIQAAKYLEDFYWAFRNKKADILSHSFHFFKKYKGPLSKYKKILQEGIALNRSFSQKKLIQCPELLTQNKIKEKFYKIYRKKCEYRNAEFILNSKKKISQREKLSLERNLWILKSHNLKDLLLQKIENSHREDKIFFSNLIKEFIYTKESLPLKEYMAFVRVDQELTYFIQKNQLFDRKDNNIFTKKLRSLMHALRYNFREKEEQEDIQESFDEVVDFFNYNKDKINDSKAWSLFLLGGKELGQKGLGKPLALELLKLSEKVANDDNLFESQLQLLLTLYRNGDYEKAISFIKKNKFIENFEKISSKLRFWIAYIYEKKNELLKAKSLHLKQISLNPLSYYSILSLKHLRSINSNYTTETLLKNAQEEFDPKKPLPLSKKSLEEAKLFHIFSKAESSFLTNLQAKELKKIKPSHFFQENFEESPNFKSLFLVTFFGLHREYLQAFRTSYDALNSGELKLSYDIIQTLFPMHYREIIKKQKSQLDHKIIMSLIRQESAFNPKAKSLVGARGLMQIMPQTGRTLKRGLKRKQLYNPQINIKLGVRFLEKLFKRYDGSLIFTLSAYNAGMGNVKKWMKTIPFTDDPILNIELIPFKETKKYIKLIYRNFFFYRLLDKDLEDIDMSVRDSFNIYSYKN